MSDFWQTVIRYAICGVAGYVLGTISAYRTAKVAGVPLLVPFVPRSSRNFTLVVLVLAMVTTFSVVTGQISATRAEECDRQFRTALRAQAGINTEDRNLEAEDDALRSERDDAMDTLVKALTAPNSNGAERAAAVDAYDAVVEANRDRRDALTERRAELEADRKAHPYPEPTCGAEN